MVQAANRTPPTTKTELVGFPILAAAASPETGLVKRRTAQVRQHQIREEEPKAEKEKPARKGQRKKALQELTVKIPSVDYILVSNEQSEKVGGAKKESKMHNVFKIEVYQRSKKVSTIIRRKSDFKKLAVALEKQSTKRGGRRTLDKAELAEIPSVPWFFRPMALFQRELPLKEKEKRREEFEEYL